MKHFNARDQAIARGVLLTKAELPAGIWHAKPTDFSQPNPACVVNHYSFSALTATGEAGRTFAQSSGVPIVESDAHVLLTPAQASRAFALLRTSGSRAVRARRSQHRPRQRGWSE